MRSQQTVARSPAISVKQRERGPSVLERLRMAELAAAALELQQHVSRESDKQSATVSSAAKSSAGKSMKKKIAYTHAVAPPTHTTHSLRSLTCGPPWSHTSGEDPKRAHCMASAPSPGLPKSLTPALRP